MFYVLFLCDTFLCHCLTLLPPIPLCMETPTFLTPSQMSCLSFVLVFIKEIFASLPRSGVLRRTKQCSFRRLRFYCAIPAFVFVQFFAHFRTILLCLFSRTSRVPLRSTEMLQSMVTASAAKFMPVIMHNYYCCVIQFCISFV